MNFIKTPAPCQKELKVFGEEFEEDPFSKGSSSIKPAVRKTDHRPKRRANAAGLLQSAVAVGKTAEGLFHGFVSKGERARW